MSKTYTTAAIAEALDAELIGDGTIVIERLAHPTMAKDHRDLVLAMDATLLPLLEKSPARAALISASAEHPLHPMDACIVIKRPRLAMAKITSMFAPDVHQEVGIHPSAVVEKSASLGKDVSIGAQCYVGAHAVVGEGSILQPQCYMGDHASLGPHSLVYSGVKIGHHVRIGARAILHFNSSIGADGFSFVTPQTGSVEAAKASKDSNVTARNETLIRIASLGAVEIGDDVEIGANTSIDRGTIMSTRIGRGTKIDNQVQIGHNVIIGEDCLICGRVGIAGSCVLGNRVVLGGAVGIADHVKIGDDVIAMAMSGIAGSIPPSTVVGGIPAVPRDRLMENLFNMNKIKQFAKKIEALTTRLDTLERQQKND